MPRLLPTPPAATAAVRVARAAAAAAAVGAALAGCTVTVDGAASALPVVEPAPPVAPTTAPSVVDGSEVAVYPEWVADGWVPRPVLPVTEPDSGVTAWMFGTAEQRPDTPDAGTAYQSLDAPASVVNWFAVFPIPEGYAPDAREGARNTTTTKNGQVISMDPVTVQGHPGLDVRIEFQTSHGQDMIDLIRYVELPGHLVGLESIGLRSDERVLQQVQQILADKLTVRSA